MASYKKRGKSWFVQVRRHGITKCSTWPTKAQAQAWAIQTESEILSGNKSSLPDKTLLEAIERYEIEVSPKKRSVRWELIRFNVWRKLPIANLPLSEVTTPIMAKWRDKRLSEVSSATVNREMNLWSALFECARREWQWIATNPVHDVRRPPQPRHRERLFSETEVNQICLALGYEGTKVVTKSQIIACAFLFALETAMRREEITGLEWNRVD
ncbi:MAG: hypothetical protein Q8L68_06465, partial [Methylococcales bacterium]|nr:hypothetical protein [Methylococcales bacterium]